VFAQKRILGYLGGLGVRKRKGSIVGKAFQELLLPFVQQVADIGHGQSLQRVPMQRLNHFDVGQSGVIQGVHDFRNGLVEMVDMGLEKMGKRGEPGDGCRGLKEIA